MQAARSCGRIVVKCLDGFPKEWPFEDRVLAWLVPDLQREIVHFHAKDGKSMSSIFLPGQIEHLDHDLRRELYKKVKSLRAISTWQFLDQE